MGNYKLAAPPSDNVAYTYNLSYPFQEFFSTNDANRSYTSARGAARRRRRKKYTRCRAAPRGAVRLSIAGPLYSDSALWKS